MTCPSCGYCQHCGRGGSPYGPGRLAPYYPMEQWPNTAGLYPQTMTGLQPLTAAGPTMFTWDNTTHRNA